MSKYFNNLYSTVFLAYQSESSLYLFALGLRSPRPYLSTFSVFGSYLLG